MPTIKVMALMLGTVALSMAAECTVVSQSRALRHAVFVFRGKVTRIDEVVTEPPDPSERVPVRRSSSGEPVVVTFETDQIWKGTAAEVVKVFLFLRPAQGYGYPFKVGLEYIVYAPSEAARWPPLARLAQGVPVYEVGSCVLRIRTDIAAESKLLGPGIAPR